MPEKKKKATCLADLMIEEMAEVDEMIEDGCFDYFDEKGACCFDDEDSDTDREWSRMLKELAKLGFTEEVE